jgi:hypothetical protein
MGDPIIALDFDAVLHEYRGWNDGQMLGPIDGALEAVQELQNRGFRVVVFSTRDEAMIRPWLAEHSFPELEICSEKPPAVCFVDDRALTFQGVWNSGLINEISGFLAHWEYGDATAG